MIIVDNDGIRGLSRPLGPQLFLITLSAFVFLGSGCNGPERIWSAEAKSPNGNVIATAQANLRNKSLSPISGIDTNVYVNWAGDKRPAMLVLNLADGSDSPADTTVEMRWLSPTHLELSYGGNRSVGFQAVKWAGVDISVRDLTNVYNGTGMNVKNRMDDVRTPPPSAYQKTIPSSSR
jgi:hypothetical protein